MTGRLAALPYHGGKSGGGPRTTGRWIASLLPNDYRVTYVEPFSGMLGVLLQREPSLHEIVNDADRRIITWWRMIRDRPDELAARIERTPWARDEYNRACEVLDDPDADPLDIALAVYVKLMQCAMSGLSRSGGWAPGYQRRSVDTVWSAARVQALADRLRRVQLECTDAVAILSRTADLAHAVIYVDPPYADTETEPYGGVTLDREALAEALRAQRGRVAISGYGDEWDHLGWMRHEHETFHKAVRARGVLPRTEVLWKNYDPIDALPMFAPR